MAAASTTELVVEIDEAFLPASVGIGHDGTPESYAQQGGSAYGEGPSPRLLWVRRPR